MRLLNEAGWDRALRVVVGLVLMYLGWGGVMAGTAGTVIGLVGLIPLVTGLVGWCPLYSVLGCATRRETR